MSNEQIKHYAYLRYMYGAGFLQEAWVETEDYIGAKHRWAVGSKENADKFCKAIKDTKDEA